MAAVTKPQVPQFTRILPASLANEPYGYARTAISAVVLAGIVWWLGRIGLWWLALAPIVILEMGQALVQRNQARLLSAVPVVIMAAAAALTISLLPKAAPQLGIATLYLVWRLAVPYTVGTVLPAMVAYLVVQAVAFEALFLAGAVWQVSAAIVVAAVWLVAFSLTYLLLQARGDKLASLLAAVWALVAAECAWLFTVWLVSYVAPAGLAIVPQPVLVLSALSYCFGGVYFAHRQAVLSRQRLAEYLFIGLVVLLLVVAGTPWRV